MGKGESNEIYAGGYDEDDPPHLNIKKAHIAT